MKHWLIQKEKEQQRLFFELLFQSSATLRAFNKEEKKNISVKVIFSKNKWIHGEADIEILGKEEHDDVTQKYSHSISNKTKDITSTDLIKMMSQGLFTNTWFSILDSSRMYDTTFVLNSDEYILEDNKSEYKENKRHETHVGFNVLKKKT